MSDKNRSSGMGPNSIDVCSLRAIMDSEDPASYALTLDYARRYDSVVAIQYADPAKRVRLGIACISDIIVNHMVSGDMSVDPEILSQEIEEGIVDKLEEIGRQL